MYKAEWAPWEAMIAGIAVKVDLLAPRRRHRCLLLRRCVLLRRVLRRCLLLCVLLRLLQGNPSTLALTPLRVLCVLLRV